ncbi:hypothetical protein [Kibdelosporangium philippinense]|uniref:hypothetical protein n=1 Tax=Kibdelosporangium philippinense TaxID=211113 RepID=UPI00361B9AED
MDDHRPIAEVARNIGVHAITLGSWVKKARGPIPRRVRHWRIRSALSWSGCVRRTPS